MGCGRLFEGHLFLQWNPEVLQAFAGFFGRRGITILPINPSQQGHHLVLVIEFGVEVAKMNGRPAPSFWRQLLLEHFLILQGCGQGVEQVFLVDFGDAQGDVLFARVLL